MGRHFLFKPGRLLPFSSFPQSPFVIEHLPRRSRVTNRVLKMVRKISVRLVRPLKWTTIGSLRHWQTKTLCCGHIVADTNVSPFARARNSCCGHKLCVRDTKNFRFCSKHFVSATNVSQFAQPRNHHEQQ